MSTLRRPGDSSDFLAAVLGVAAGGGASRPLLQRRSRALFEPPAGAVDPRGGRGLVAARRPASASNVDGANAGSGAEAGDAESVARTGSRAQAGFAAPRGAASPTLPGALAGHDDAAAAALGVARLAGWARSATGLASALPPGAARRADRVPTAKEGAASAALGAALPFDAARRAARPLSTPAAASTDPADHRTAPPSDHASTPAPVHAHSSHAGAGRRIKSVIEAHGARDSSDPRAALRAADSTHAALAAHAAQVGSLQAARSPTAVLLAQAQRAGDLLQRGQAAAAPPVHVSIGRIDIRAVAAAPNAAPRPAARAAPALTLDAYLRARLRGPQ